MTPPNAAPCTPPPLSKRGNGSTPCPHYATQGRDWQTTDNMSAASRVMARRHLETLRAAD